MLIWSDFSNSPNKLGPDAESTGTDLQSGPSFRLCSTKPPWVVALVTHCCLLERLEKTLRTFSVNRTWLLIPFNCSPACNHSTTFKELWVAVQLVFALTGSVMGGRCFSTKRQKELLQCLAFGHSLTIHPFAHWWLSG